MGRYYNSTSGNISGKFAFGTQSSNVPETWGMYEDNRITYSADADNLPTLKENQERLYKIISKEQYKRLDDYMNAENTYSDEKIVAFMNVSIEQAILLQSAYFDLIILNQVIDEVEKEGYCELECEQ